MKNIIFMCIATMFLPFIIQGQEFETNQIIKAEISKLSFLVGNWEGKGWMMGPHF